MHTTIYLTRTISVARLINAALHGIQTVEKSSFLHISMSTAVVHSAADTQKWQEIAVLWNTIIRGSARRRDEQERKIR